MDTTPYHPDMTPDTIERLERERETMENRAATMRERGIVARAVPTVASIAGRRAVVGWDVEITA
jgi:hypothetical protein